jgi:hypothetical protein
VTFWLDLAFFLLVMLGVGAIVLMVVSLLGDSGSINLEEINFQEAGQLIAAIVLAAFVIWLYFRNKYRHKEEAAAEQERKRQAAIAQARTDPYRFEIVHNYNQGITRLAAENNDFSTCASGLQKQLHYYKDKNDGAIGLINEAITAFETMQQEANRKLIPEYDTALSPYRDELPRNLELSRSARLKATYNLEILQNVDAAQFNWEMRSISRGTMQDVNPVYGSYQSGKISAKRGAAMIAASLLVGQLQKRRGRRWMRTAYEKAQAEIDVFAEETASNLQACEGAYTLIMQWQTIYKELSRDTR